MLCSKNILIKTVLNEVKIENEKVCSVHIFNIVFWN